MGEVVGGALPRLEAGLNGGRSGEVGHGLLGHCQLPLGNVEQGTAERRQVAGAFLGVLNREGPPAAATPTLSLIHI
eukprot:506757-Alexandrium_andersonii.AAC.1